MGHKQETEETEATELQNSPEPRKPSQSKPGIDSHPSQAPKSTTHRPFFERIHQRPSHKPRLTVHAGRIAMLRQERVKVRHHLKEEYS